MLTPAELTLEVLQQFAPKAADYVAPFLSRLFQAWNNGHSFIWLTPDERTHLINNAKPLIGFDHHSPLVLYGNKLFLARFWHLEQRLAQEIHKFVHIENTSINEDIIILLNQWFDDKGSKDQQAAAALTLLKHFTFISGGPGTGKTTTVAKLLALLCMMQNKPLPTIALSAPTGKAASRLSEALINAVAKIPNLPTTIREHLNHLQGQTIHRLLGLTPPQMHPKYHATNHLPLDVLIIDEASMIDNYLLLQLLSALPKNCRVILLGDENQLPPVEGGAILQHLSKYKPNLSPQTSQSLQTILAYLPNNLSEHRAHLRISHRFNDNSGIGNLARTVIAGDADAAWQQFSKFPQELEQLQGNINEQATELYHRHHAYWQAISTGNIQQAFTHYTDICVLTALRNDAKLFNQAYKNLLQKQGHIKTNSPWFDGQILMITRNDAPTLLFNGDIGIVLKKENNLSAWFATGKNQFKSIALSRLPEHDTAFAFTVHKSQGSEYNEVWLLSPQQHNNTITNNFERTLLYTAITRAKQHFVYWGDENTFKQACLLKEQRRSALTDWLKT